MGLGKTASVLRALTPECLPVLVTAPPRVARAVWPEETQIWRPDLSITVADGGPAGRREALRSPKTDIVVMSRESLADAVPFAAKYNTFVIDELSGFKSHGTQRFRAARKIATHPLMGHVWGLTGTPSPNGLMDLWAQMYLIDGGKRLGPKVTAFRERYFAAGRSLPSGTVIEWNIRPGAEKRIHRLLEDIALSMTTDGRLDLPPIVHNIVRTPLPDSIMKMYKKFKRELVLNLDVLGGSVHTASGAGVLTNYLSQITAGFLYQDSWEQDHGNRKVDRIHNEKTEAVQEIVAETGSPVLIAYRFREEKEALLKVFGSRAHTIDEPDVQSRWNAGDLPVLLVHPQSAGHGLNLQKGPGHTLVWATMPWSLEEYQQTGKRLHRQGQDQPVVVHHLVAPGTIDEAIMLALTEKRSIQDALMEHLESPL